MRECAMMGRVCGAETRLRGSEDARLWLLRLHAARTIAVCGSNAQWQNEMRNESFIDSKNLCAYY